MSYWFHSNVIYMQNILPFILNNWPILAPKPWTNLLEVYKKAYSIYFSCYREPETQRNAWPFGSSMAEWQRFGCHDTWPWNWCNYKQTSSLWFPIRWGWFFSSVASLTNLIYIDFSMKHAKKSSAHRSHENFPMCVTSWKTEVNNSVSFLCEHLKIL